MPPPPMKVSSQSLVRLAGVIWVAVSLRLGMVARQLLQAAAGEPQKAGPLAIGLAVAIGLTIGAAKGAYVLRPSAAKNRRRLEKLRRGAPWEVFSKTLWILVLGMILLGVSLRKLAAAGYMGGPLAIGGLYVGLSAALLVSSLAYFLAPKPGMVLPLASAPPANGPVGLLLVNLGTPDAPDAWSVRRYLKEFLSDPRVVEVPRLLWWPILHLFILTFRPYRSAKLYRKVWTKEGSPLLTYTKRQAAGVQERLGTGWRVECAMRYGNPGIPQGLEALVAAGCHRIVVLPLFPQYSAATSASVSDAVGAWLKRRRDQPSIQLAPAFPVDPGYLAAQADRIRASTNGESATAHHVFSFHGIPESYVKRGDPYAAQCRATAEGLADELELSQERWSLVFQSRFGPEPWLQPYADERVPELAREHDKIVISTPGFVSDCLETIDEIGRELAEDCTEAGGTDPIVVPALNDSPRWLDALADLARGLAGSQDSDNQPAA